MNFRIPLVTIYEYGRVGQGTFSNLNWDITSKISASHNPKLVYCRKLSTNQEDSSQGDPESKSNGNSSFHGWRTRQNYERKKSYYEESKRFNRDQSTLDPPIRNTQITHYQRLNVDSTASQADIKSAYYSLSKLYHPDIVGTDDPTAAENFRLATESYDVLSNAETREQYDREISPSTSLKMDTYSDKSMKTDYEEILRTRNAEIIFKNRQEAAIAREKLMNPRKFQAGTFKSESEPQTFRGLENDFRLDFGSIPRNARGTVSQDGSDFYRMHLYSSVQRRREETRSQREVRETIRQYNGPGSTDLVVEFFTIIGASIVSLIIFALYSFDVFSYLDAKLESKRKASEDESE